MLIWLALSDLIRDKYFQKFHLRTSYIARKTTYKFITLSEGEPPTLQLERQDECYSPLQITWLCSYCHESGILLSVFLIFCYFYLLFIFSENHELNQLFSANFTDVISPERIYRSIINLSIRPVFQQHLCSKVVCNYCPKHFMVKQHLTMLSG